MNKNLEVTVWSSSNLDLKNMDLVLSHDRKTISGFEPTPYTFTTIENGKKTTTDPSSLSPPSWLLLDHTIAVIWSMFSLSTTTQLSIDDLKWAYEFLKEIRNKRGENPPDVKVCLKEIQDRLINSYAKLTSLKEGKAAYEDFDEIAAAFGEKIIADSSTSYLDACVLNRDDGKLDAASLCSSITPSRTTIKLPVYNFLNRSSKDIVLSKTGGNAKHHRIAMNYSKKTFPLLEKDSNIFEETENTEDEEVEKYILSLFDEDKKNELQRRISSKSFIPTKRKTPTTLAFSELISSQDSSGEIPKKEKSSKKVHCVAEMRSLKFQKSMKVQDTNGEEAAYSNFKAEIRRLTVNPNVSTNEKLKYLKELKSEQVGKLNNQLKRLNSIEEFMKFVSKDGCEPHLRSDSSFKLKELQATTSNYSLSKNFLP